MPFITDRAIFGGWRFKTIDRRQILAIEQHRILRNITIAIVWGGMLICCTLAIKYFYGLHSTATLYPYKNQFEQNVAVVRTALIATVASSWAIWFGIGKEHRVVIVALRTGLASLLTLTIYGIAGCGGLLGGDSIVGGWHRSTDAIFPSTFFSEYNWLTFVLEVAPTTSLFAALLVYALFRLQRYGKTRTTRGEHL